MQKKVTQKERNLKKLSSIQEKATNLLNNRASLLINNVDKEFLKYIKFNQKQDDYQRIIDHFQDVPRKTQKFRLHALAGETRFWEGLSLDQNGQRRFQIDSSYLKVRINSEFQVNYLIMSSHVEVQKIHNTHPLILAAKNNILRNLKIVGKIITNEKLPQSIEQFFTETKFYSYSFTQLKNQRADEFENNLKQQEPEESELEQSQSEEQDSENLGGPNNLKGLSTYNGKKTYINKILLDNSEKEFHLIDTPLGNDNEDYNQLPTINKTLVTLEHEGLHNFIRLLMNNDPQFIPPKKNDKLRVDGQMQEAGNYYAFKASRIKAEVSPFCLNLQKLK